MERLSLSVGAEPRRECRSPTAKWRHVKLQDFRMRSEVIGMSTGSGGSGEYLSNNSANSGSSGGHHSNRHNATFVDDSGGQPDIAGMPRGLSHKMRGHRDHTEAWWSMGEFLNPGHNGGLTHQSTKFSLTGNRVFSSNYQEELWDLSDSLAELHDTVNRNSMTDSLQMRQQQDREVNIKEWLESDVGSGFIRVYPPNVNSYATSYLIPCTLTTTAHQVCLMLGISLNSLHVQYNGDIIQRLDTYEHPLMMQNEYLVGIGYCDLDRIQEEGTNEDLGYLIRFYYGKPTFDSTFSRKQLQAYIDVRKGKMLQQWVPRMCVVSGTRLLIYKGM
ncbi:hypothetical protein NP493_36g04045 [Ridgeia piscesae]|uniref:PHLPP-like RA domain-containing protein n=1 Tax=Ridgeia piscesae TaxID=27915 RepID=A0AAD9PCM9_RIDPI|nr:hypothetical protein NP493_36g04045 [Ridgeia piscesae]